VSDHRRFTIAAGNFACSATKLSIRTILGLVIALLGLLLVATSVAALVEIAGRHGTAQSVAARAPVSQQFFKSLQALPPRARVTR